MSQERLCLNISSVDYVADNGYWSIIGDLRYNKPTVELFEHQGYYTCLTVRDAYSDNRNKRTVQSVGALKVTMECLLENQTR